jgi:phosphatidylserine decarboxylase
VRAAVPPLHPAGRPFVAAPLALAVLGRKHKWVRRAGLISAAAAATFFRHPNRVAPSRAGVAVAPADGEIVLNDLAVPPAELGLGTAPLPRISIFLSVLDAHVQRAPVAGTVTARVYQRGKFLSANLPEASDANERNSIVLRTSTGQELIVTQIAGLIARRIVCDITDGDTVSIGDTYGLIRFGSRVDTYFPTGSVPQVDVGQRAIGGETVLAELPTQP